MQRAPIKEKEIIFNIKSTYIGDNNKVLVLYENDEEGMDYIVEKENLPWPLPLQIKETSKIEIIY